MYTPTQERGFSLPELVAVIIIASVLSATAITKWSGSGINLAAEAERIASDIRYIQSYSTTHDQRYRINFTSNSYSFSNLAGSTPLAHPVTNATSVAPGNGVTLSYTNSFIAFDGLGVPYTTSTLPGTALATTSIITLTSGSQTRTVQVTQETGRVVVP